MTGMLGASITAIVTLPLVDSEGLAGSYTVSCIKYGRGPVRKLAPSARTLSVPRDALASVTRPPEPSTTSVKAAVLFSGSQYATRPSSVPTVAVSLRLKYWLATMTGGSFTLSTFTVTAA